jgi:hypothetical protein
MAICVKAGYYFATKLNRAKIKKHGYRAQSICREGRDFLLETLKMGVAQYRRMGETALELFCRRLEKMLSTIAIHKKIIG